jgi:hypothetical protein
MQTFLPFADFADSAASLDPRRLGKQRVEVLQIVRAITWPKYGWRNHPAANMWRGFETPRTTRLPVADPGADLHGGVTARHLRRSWVIGASAG